MGREKSPYLRCGEIINTHGVRGVVKARCECDSPEIMRELPRVFVLRAGKYVPYEVTGASIQKGFLLLTLSGVNTLEDAIALKGQILYAERGELEKFLEPGDRFIADLIGMPIVDDDTGVRLGVLKDVYNVGASDIYVVDTDHGERMMPAVDEFVSEITDEEIRVRPIEGMLD